MEAIIILVTIVLTIILYFTTKKDIMESHKCPNCGSVDTEEVGDRVIYGNISTSRHICHKCGRHFMNDHINIKM